MAIVVVYLVGIAMDLSNKTIEVLPKDISFITNLSDLSGISFQS